ncbi:MAG: Holliday junction resolvase Hjc [Candidatus Micrarchaeia archaeon]|jgi:Holliday junction resolvase
MSFYSKGARAERELLGILSKKGFIVIRAAGSGVNSISPDVIAIKNSRVYAFECKFWDRENLDIKKEKIEYLIEIEKHGIKSFIAWKIPREGWFFINLKELKKGNKFYSISKTKALEINRNIDFLV